MAYTLQTVLDPTMWTVSPDTGGYTWTAEGAATLGYTDSNSTGNGSTSDTHEGTFEFDRILLVYLAVIFILIVIGNTCVLVAILMSKQGHRSRMNFFIMHLAIADLTNAFGVVLVELIWKVVIVWHAGTALCKLVKYIQSVVTYGSTFVLVSLSIDRLDAIARPMSFTGSGLRAKILIVLAWVLAMLFGIPMLIFYHVEEKDHIQACWMRLPGTSSRQSWQLYLTLVACSLFFMPTLVITVCYVIIILIIWDKSRGLRPLEPKSSRAAAKEQSNGSLGKTKRQDSGSDSKSSSRGVIPQAKIRTIKMTVIIVVAFVLCWCPFFINNLLLVYEVIDPRDVPNSVKVLIQMLTPLNSFANPVIYGIFSTRICRHLRKFRTCNWLMDKVCCCCPSLQMPLRQQSMYMTTNSTTYTAIDGSMRKRSLPRGRRQSGPPVVRGVLTDKENQILLKTLGSEKSLHKTDSLD